MVVMMMMVMMMMVNIYGKNGHASFNHTKLSYSLYVYSHDDEEQREIKKVDEI